MAGGPRGRASRRSPAAREWWQHYFDAHYLLEYEPIFSPERDRREVARLVEILGLPLGAHILDVPCGQGRHAYLLAEAGYTVRGFDYSADLIRLARQCGQGPLLRYTRGDMRRMPAAWTAHFDAVLNLFTSFGFFLDPADDARVVAELARVLAPGGVLVWHGASRDGVMARFLARDWWKAYDGTLVAHERSMDPLSGVMHVRSSWRGPSGEGERDHRIRLYTATRLAELCAAAGLIVVEAFDGWRDRPLRRTSSEMLLVARRDGGADAAPVA
ncbi:MAG: methyltransferase domain-containing protein [Gemmatimonadota bacterium]|nr:methyltransferase domain-containing protein [Gemmatimonadota bacterium]